MDMYEVVKNSKSSSFNEMIKMEKKPGLIMEFGVYSGNSITEIANHNEQTIYGFDSFEGLPEWWMPGYDAGHFKCDVPNVPKNVVLVKGYFSDTLPTFITEHPEFVSLIHIDCDLYSSTKCIFDNLKNKFQDGSIIIFDELIDYGDQIWREHEYKAFNEFLEETKYRWDCIGRYGGHQAGFIIYK
jgi:hypothetical protein